MRGLLLLVFCLTACGDDDPPTLPGDRPAPCDLGEPRAYLVTQIDPDVERGEMGGFLDFSEPLDELNDNALGTYYRGHPVFQPFWEPAMAAAVDDLVLRWVMLVETCDGDGDHARVSLRRADEVDEATSPPVVVLADDRVVPAVGSMQDATIAADLGVGLAPPAALLDSGADLAGAIWLEAHFVGVLEMVEANDMLSGFVYFAARTDPTYEAVSEGLARTLTEAAAADPGCPDQCVSEGLGILLRGYDTNEDGIYEAEEVLASGFMATEGIRPSLDIFAEDGEESVYWPGHDELPDSIGAFVRIDARRATLVSQ